MIEIYLPQGYDTSLVSSCFSLLFYLLRTGLLQCYNLEKEEFIDNLPDNRFTVITATAKSEIFIFSVSAKVSMKK